jgi:hypothetical protein
LTNNRIRVIIKTQKERDIPQEKELNIMKIFITAVNLEAFWNYFSPKGLISLASNPTCGGIVCIVDVCRFNGEEYTEEYIANIYSELENWAVAIR